MFFSSIKEMNRHVKHLLLRKTDVLKTCIFSERKFEEVHYLWRAKGCKVYSRKRLCWHCCLHLSFIYKIVSQISFNLFWSGDKRLLLEFLRKWSWFHENNERFPKYFFGWKLKFQKTETRFCRLKNNDYNNINIFQSLENPCTFLLAKENTWKHIFNTTRNYHKIVQKNKLCHSKQH